MLTKDDGVVHILRTADVVLANDRNAPTNEYWLCFRDAGEELSRTYGSGVQLPDCAEADWDTPTFSQMQALYVGHQAGLPIPDKTVKMASVFLDSVQADSGGSYGYTTPGSTASTSAIGLYAKLLMGVEPKEGSGMKLGLDRLAKMGPSTTALYFNYYATYALQGREEHEAAWREALHTVLVKSQSDEGKETGSWFLSGDQGAGMGGRLYCTSMALLALEASFRYTTP